MKKSITKSIQNTMLIMNIIIFIYIATIFIFKSTLNTLIYPLNVAFFMLLVFSSVKLLGYKKNKKNKTRMEINNVFIVVSILFLVSIYLIGNATGFIKNTFDFLKCIYLLIYLILAELFRYIYLTKCNKNSNNQYIITLLFILIDILILSEFSPINFLSIVDLLSITFISVLKNSLLSYTSYRYGYRPCFIYSFIMTLLPVAAPTYPNLGNYINVIFNLTYAAVIFYNISKPTRKEEEETANTYKKNIFFYIERILLVFIVITIFLVSGAFKYSISAIASDSMYPELRRGDAVILERVDDKNRETLKKGMIVAFKQDDSIITHRILSIELKDGEEYIITKGDNNSTKDMQKKKKDDIIGIVVLRIPLIGYPSVEISEIGN